MNRSQPNLREIGRVLCNPVESLERRQHLSATLKAGTLTITGTPGKDAISVSLKPHDSKKLDVAEGKHHTYFDLKSVKKLRIIGQSGNDTIVVSVSIPASIDGGSGNDVIRGGPANDAIVGGGGNDAIKGGAGDDVLDGGSGNDSLDGGPGADILKGSAGNDALHVETVPSGVTHDMVVQMLMNPNPEWLKMFLPSQTAAFNQMKAEAEAQWNAALADLTGKGLANTPQADATKLSIYSGMADRLLPYLQKKLVDAFIGGSGVDTVYFDRAAGLVY